MGNTLSVNNLFAGYGEKAVISGFSFESGPGELTGIIGSNGSGKSTLLRGLCGLIPAGVKGDVFYGDKNLSALSARKKALFLSFIPQRSGISVSMPVMDVVLMGFNPELGLLEKPGKIREEKALAALSEAGLSGKEKDDYLTLSEGQKQLCMLARLFAADRPVWILDEPESALDFGARYRMLRLLKEKIRRTGGTAVLALHDPQLALSCCSRLVFLKDGKCTGVLEPGREPDTIMEQKLSELYGPVSVHRLTDRCGKEHPVMIREDGHA